MSDDPIGTITGTATFDAVDVIPQDGEKVRVRGQYGQSETVYETDHDRLYIAGAQAALSEGTLSLHAGEGSWLWVKATDDELRITKEKPENE